MLQGYEDLLFVVWDGKHKHYVLPTPQEFDQLSAFNGPIPVSEDRLSADFDNRSDLDEALDRFGRSDPCLLLPEIRSEEEYRGIRRYARVRELGIGAIFYDAIAILHPNLCSKEIELNHGAYMRGLAECDVVVPISHFSANCLTEYWKSCDVQPTRVIVSAPPGEFAPSERKLKPIAPPNGTVEILCVSTLEPRKNHRVLIEACLRLQERNPDVDWRLNLVGNRCADAPEIAEYVEREATSNPRIRWHGVVDDMTLYCAGSARTGERTLRVSVDAALRAGIFKASGSFDPMGWSVGARRSFPRP